MSTIFYAQPGPTFSVPFSVDPGACKCFDNIVVKFSPCFCDPLNPNICANFIDGVLPLSRPSGSSSPLSGTIVTSITGVDPTWTINWACSHFTICFGPPSNPECHCFTFNSLPTPQPGGKTTTGLLSFDMGNVSADCCNISGCSGVYGIWVTPSGGILIEPN